MSVWGTKKGRKVLNALYRIGWKDHPNNKQGGSHLQLVHPSLGSYTWPHSDAEEIGPRMLARIAKQTGLKPEDL